MAIKVQDAGTLRTITGGKVRVGGVTRDLRAIKVMDGGTLRTVATFSDELSATASPGARTATGSTSSLTTASITAQPTGGQAPYTYAWTLTTNGGGTASVANTPSLATTTFTKSGLSSGTTVTDQWIVTVTDAVGSTALAGVSVTFIRLS